MSTDLMTSSLPNMDMTELDKLSDRLGKFKSPSRLPKPEISPKPAYLAAQLAKHKMVESTTESKIAKPKVMEPKPETKKEVGTGAMLKSTLKRMTKLTTSPVTRTNSFKAPPVTNPGEKSSENARKTPMMNRSNSLRKVKNKDFNPLARSGTSGTLDRNFGGVKRTPSMNTVNSSRRFRDRDLSVKLSRGVQTQLTKDTMDEPEFTNDGDMPTNVEFTVYLPDLFGGDTGNDGVETHVSEPTEPIDVRKNRQLTLDNMKLHRELEKLKQSANEHDLVKKELRNVKGKLEEEQKLRAKIELQLDTHNKKVKEISGVMDTVEREMEKRDANIVDLEGQVHVEKSKIESLEAELQKATKIIDSQKNELLAARQSQKNLVQHCEHVEAESRELQEFLQVEKLALTETLRDTELEVDTLKSELKNKDLAIKEAEERCGHLVRCGEQKNQEHRTFSDVAKNMLINQGIELYRISAKIANLHSKVSLKEQKSPVKDVDTVRQEIENLFEKLTSNTREDGTDSLKNLSLAIEKRRRSESLMVNGSNASPNVSVLEQIDKVEQILDTQQQNIHQNNGQSDDQNDQNQINVNDESMNKSITSGTTDEVRAKLLKHLEIYKANVASQEEEIKHMDELYQDLVDSVLNTIKCLPDTFNTHPDLLRLKQRLESEELTTPENGSKNGTRVNLERLQNQEQANLSL